MSEEQNLEQKLEQKKKEKDKQKDKAQMIDLWMSNMGSTSGSEPPKPVV